MENTQEQIKQLKEQVENLRKTICTLEEELSTPKINKERVFGFLPEAGNTDDGYYVLDCSDKQTNGRGMLATYYYDCTDLVQENYKGLFWKTSTEANNFAKAINTFLELRTLEGVVPFEAGVENYTISNRVGSTGVDILVQTLSSQNSELSPCFSSKELGEQAIRTIGEDQLRHMFNTLSGIDTVNNT